MANDITTAIKGSTRCTVAEEREHEIPLMAKRVVEIPSNMQTRFEYNADGTEKYVGYGARGLASSNDGWLIYKFTYNANAQPTLIQTAYDAWDDRATASYA